MFLRNYLQTHHWISRRKLTELIDQWKIFLNWEIIDSYKQEIQNGEHLVVNTQLYKINEKIKISEQQSDAVMVLFNKPVGYVVSKSDRHNMTIYELLPKELQWYYYIGRLDKDSHGLLLLTNDPKLVNEYEHPKFEIEKEYIVKINAPFRHGDIKKMITWIEDEGELLKIMRATPHVPKWRHDNVAFLNIILHEGKKRHIRRIFKSLGYRVLDLQRIREGQYTLDGLKLGTWKNV